VLLAGSGTLDPRNYTGLGYMDFVPTKLVDVGIMETASDDWMVDFNGDGNPQMAIGRLPVRTAAEAMSVVSKIVNYDQASKANGLMLLSDLNDGIDFNSANAQINTIVGNQIPVSQILRTDDVTAARTAFFNLFTQGGQIVNYDGHGSVDLWRAGWLTDSDAPTLVNHTPSPLVVTMTCLNGYFIDPRLASLGETLFKVDNGGAVAVWASSGMTDVTSQDVMNQEFFRQLFGNTTITVGQAIKSAKAAAQDNDVRRTWILFGDPTMKVKVSQ
jgi:hypothetical protein